MDQVTDRTILTKRGEHWEADGWTQLSDIERSLQTEFGEEVDANTLSGLFMFRLTRIPEKGDTIVEQGFRFTVESMAERRVNVVRIETEGEAAAGVPGE